MTSLEGFFDKPTMPVSILDCLMLDLDGPILDWDYHLWLDVVDLLPEQLPEIGPPSSDK